MTKQYQYTPKELVNLALHQRNVFIFCQHNKDINVKITSLTNLRLAFELVLKAYLIHLNKDYKSEDKLKKLNHNLVNIKNLINLEKGNVFKTQLNFYLINMSS